MNNQIDANILNIIKELMNAKDYFTPALKMESLETALKGILYLKHQIEENAKQ